MDYVYLADGFAEHETPYGVGVSIQDARGLRAAIAHDLVTSKRYFDGREIRLLRKQLGLTQEGVATLMDNSVQTVARWEKGETEIPGSADRLLRVLYIEKAEGNPRVEELLNVFGHAATLGRDEERRRRTPYEMIVEAKARRGGDYGEHQAMPVNFPCRRRRRLTWFDGRIHPAHRFK